MIALSAILIVIFSLPYFIPAKKAMPGLKDVEAHRENGSGAPLHFADDSVGAMNADGPELRPYEGKKPVRRFRFDPNTLNATGWQNLGVRDRTITTIQRYISKGGKFRRPEDLAKVYGLSHDLVQELLPYVAIKENQQSINNFRKDQSWYYQNQANTSMESNTGGTGREQTTYKARPSRVIADIDINTADSSAFESLPGIGGRLAMRIINFRQKLGGFYDIAQIAEVFGLPDSTFRNLKPHLTISSGKIQKIQLNTAPADLMKAHPYIRWNLANAIIAYRTEHGPFKEITEINRIALITPEIFARLSPYLEP